MGLSDRCSAGTPAVSPAPRSWRPGASQWPSSSCSAGGLPGPLSGARSRRRWLAESATPGAPGGRSQLAVPLALADATPGEGQSNEGTVGCPGGTPGTRKSPPRAGGPRSGGPSTSSTSPGRGGYTSPTRMRPWGPGGLARSGAAGRTAGDSSSGCPPRGVLPALLPGGTGRLQRGCGEFVGLVLSGLAKGVRLSCQVRALIRFPAACFPTGPLNRLGLSLSALALPRTWTRTITTRCGP